VVCFLEMDVDSLCVRVCMCLWWCVCVCMCTRVWLEERERQCLLVVVVRRFLNEMAVTWRLRLGVFVCV